jgi:hypothetical protein
MFRRRRWPQVCLIVMIGLGVAVPVRAQIGAAAPGGWWGRW